MAVAFDASSESHTGTTDATSVATHSWTHAPVGTPRGIVVFTINRNTSNDIVTAVTYGGVSMTAVSGGFAADSSGEVGATKAWFLGASIPTGNQTVQITRTNNVNGTYGIAFSVTAAADTEIKGTPVLIQGDSTIGEVAVDSGGDVALRFAASMSGGSNVAGAGASSNNGPVIDFGTRVHESAYEKTAGSGSRNVGFGTVSSDDCALVALAVGEVAGNQVVTPSAASLTTTGSAPAVSRPVLVTPSTVSLTTTGSAPSVSLPVVAQPSAASLSTTGSAPAITLPVTVQPAASALTTTGTTPVIATGITPSQGALATTASAPTVAVSDNQVALPVAAALTSTASAPAVATPVTVDPSAAALVTTGEAPDIVVPVAVETTETSLALTASAPFVFTSEPGAYQPSPAELALEPATPDVAVTNPVTVLPVAVSLTLTRGTPVVDVTSSSGDVVVVPLARGLTLSGKRPTVQATKPPVRRQAVGAPESVVRDIPRAPRPRVVRPKAGHLSLVTAALQVSLIDDGDVMAALAQIV